MRTHTAPDQKNAQESVDNPPAAIGDDRNQQLFPDELLVVFVQIVQIEKFEFGIDWP